MTDGQSGYSRSQVNNALANYDKFKYATTRSDTNIDEIITNTENKTYYQLLSGDSKGTRPPNIGSAIVQTFRWDTNYSVQTAYEMNTNHTAWIRYNNNGTWSSWERVATESDLKLVLEKTVALAKGSNTITFATNSSYLLVTSGSNYGQGICFVSQGYNTSVIKGTVLANNISFGSNEYSSTRQMTITNNGGGEINLNIYRIR